MSLIDNAVRSVRMDADASDAKLDRLLAGLDKISTRLDAVEETQKEIKKDAVAEPVAAKTDADDGKLDKILGHMDSLHAKHDALKSTCDSLHAKHDSLETKHDAIAKRMDAIEESKKEPVAETVEPAPVVTDSVPVPEVERTDAETAEAVKKMVGDSVAPLLAEIATLKSRLPAEIPADQKASFTAAQSKWEKVAQLFGDSAGADRPMNGESLPDYNRRLMGKYKVHSKAWKDQDLDKLPDAVLGVAIDQIHADAVAAAVAPAPTTDGVLSAREFRDSMTGRMTRKFYGDIGVMLDLSRNQRQYVTGFPTIQRH